MAFIKSISGFRGTIGGKPGDNLTPIDIVKAVTGYGAFLKQNHAGKRVSVVLGRDARMSGAMVSSLVEGTLSALGIDVISLGLATTPTVEMAVVGYKAQGGIILTASHNPKQWNALKLLNDKGEFITADNGKQVLSLGESDVVFADVDELGDLKKGEYLEAHVEAICNLSSVNPEAIQKSNFKVLVDGINSIGAEAIPAILKALGVKDFEVINAEMTGDFAHNPEPLKEHLTELCALVKSTGADMGIVVDPDVDRLAFVMENGEMFGEEYTLVAAADHYLKFNSGALVSNMSSSRALADLAQEKGVPYFSSEVGEVNVVRTMKANNAAIGGEGNGGVILPELHYGRDSLVGVGLVLSLMAESGKSLTEIRAGYQHYEMIKDKINLDPSLDVDALLLKIKEVYHGEKIDDRDGVKIDLSQGWVHLRKSNTEPIIRVYAEAPTTEIANEMVENLKSKLSL
ncbi:MAG: phosphomannomutase [Luteibaculaceae bacterium]|jgi:phosphomannomutase